MLARDSIPSSYFENMFAADPDPWRFETSDYEKAKYAHTVAALDGRRYGWAFEIGCANGVLTRMLSDVTATLMSIDVSESALTLARARNADNSAIRFARMRFPEEAPSEGGFDLIVVSEVAYYWSDADLQAAATRIRELSAQGCDLLLVHWIGETDYPQTADGAVERLAADLGDAFQVRKRERTADYRLDLWSRCRP